MLTAARAPVSVGKGGIGSSDGRITQDEYDKKAPRNRSVGIRSDVKSNLQWVPIRLCLWVRCGFGCPWPYCWCPSARFGSRERRSPRLVATATFARAGCLNSVDDPGVCLQIEGCRRPGISLPMQCCPKNITGCPKNSTRAAVDTVGRMPTLQTNVGRMLAAATVVRKLSPAPKCLAQNSAPWRKA